MKNTLSSVALAMCLTATNVSYAQRPIDGCRQGNQANLQAIDASYEQALRNFELVKADREKYLAARAPIVERKPGGGTLEDCKRKTGEIAKLGDLLNALRAGHDRELAACQRDNNAHYTAIEVAIDTHAQERNKGGLTPTVEGKIWEFRRKIDADRKAAQERGFTMADCRAIAQTLAIYHTYVNTICYDSDTSLGKVKPNIVCAKVVR